MSEPAEDVPVEPGRGDIWIERYRPQRLEDIVGHDDIISRLQSYVDRDDLPNLLFAGPAGTGKCVTGETPVLTNRGVEPIEDVVGEIDGFEAPPPDLQVLTIDHAGEFSYVSPDHVYSREADELREIRTRDGGSTTVTPEHQFLVLDRDGFRWKPAETLSEGDRVVRPGSIPVGDDDTDSESTVLHSDDGTRAKFLREHFDANGDTTTDGCLELSHPDRDLITRLSYLLASFGIPSRRGTERKAATNGSGTERTYHTLSISGTEHLARFHQQIGFDHPEKADRLEAQLDREPNPNHDTIPTQTAVDHLSDRLALRKTEYVPASLNSDSPSRQTYLGCLDRFVDDAIERIETAQQGLERLDPLQPTIDAVTDLPVTWETHRKQLIPVDRRHELANETGVREDALLTYADGRRTPRTDRTVMLLQELECDVDREAIASLQTELRTIIDELGISYKRIAEETPFRGTDLINALTNEDHALSSLARFGTVATRLREEIQGMLSQAALADLTHLEALSSADLYFDAVTEVERVEENQRVYDLSVSGTRNYVAGTVPTVMHNTTAAQAIARELFGDDWQENFLELNASDDRGIDVVRGRIKEFARASFGGHDYRIIFLDEADSLTADAQSALRRTMEQFSHNTRFILNANYSSRIIDPIQSRCAVFRFTSIDDEAVAGQIRMIAENEGIEITDEGVDAIVYAAAGDMRKAINALQGAAVLGDVVDEQTVYTITATARPEVVEEMVTKALGGDFQGSRAILSELLDDAGLAGGDVIDQLHRSVWDFELDDQAAIDLLERIGEADYRITEGANERIQLEALLAATARRGGS